MGFRSKLELEFNSQAHSIENEILHFSIWGDPPTYNHKIFCKKKKTGLLACNKKYSWEIPYRSSG